VHGERASARTAPAAAGAERALRGACEANTIAPQGRGVNIHAEGAREAITIAERNSRNEHQYEQNHTY
jgi:hypothetical protein